MTPKEKAWDLIRLYRNIEFNNGENCYLMISMSNAKQCALIAVDEILQALSYGKLNNSPYKTLEARQYYVQVKLEIEKL